MANVLEQIENYKKEIASFKAENTETLEAFRIKYIGTKGLVKSVMGEMKNIPNEEKNLLVRL